MVVHVYNPTTWRLKQDREFKASLGYVVRLGIKKPKIIFKINK
jgi:hypothetical protein